jgi:membrane protease YdiL (CAAX protease family)
MRSWTPLLAPLLNVLVGATLAGMVTAWVWLVVQVRHHRRLFGPAVTREVPWGLGTVAASLLSWFVLNIVVIVGYRAATHRAHGVPLAFTEQMFLITAVNALALVVLPLLARALSGASAADFGLVPSAVRGPLGTGALAFLIVTWPVNLLHGLCVVLWPVHQKHPLEEMVRAGLDPAVAYLALLSAVILAPAVEELLFRGLLQGWLTKALTHWRSAVRSEPDFEREDAWDVAESTAPEPAARPVWLQWMPIVVTSLVFAAAHGAQWPSPIPIFILSLALGFLYQRTGSLLASFALHALFNGFSTLLLFWVLVHGDGKAAKAVPEPPSVAAPGADTPPDRN